MYSFYREIHPPTGVDHCVQCNFYSHAEKNVVVACSSYLHVYRLTESGVSESSGGSGHCKLQQVGEYQLYGNVESMGSVELVDSCREALLLAFSSAKLSIVEYDPATEDLQTISLHYFEEDDIRDGMRLTNHRPIVKIDPEGRCATMLIYGSKLVVLPFRHDSLLDEQDLQSPQLSHNDRSAVLPSLVINLRELATPVINVKDYQFLHGYHNPTILFLCEHLPSWSGRVPVRKDTCGIVAVSINMSGQQYPVIWTMANLPFDCFKAIAVPKPLGGVLVFAVNSLHYLNQSFPSVDVSLNSITDNSTNVPLKKQPGVVLTLDSCNATFLAHDQLLVSLKGGEIYVVTLVVDSVTVRGMKSFIFTKTAAGVITSCMCCVGSQYLFLGSRLGNSLLLKYTSKRQLDLVTSPGQLAFKRIKTEDWMADDTDDLEMYGSEATSGGAHHISYSFEVCDSIVNIGPIAGVTLGEPGFVSEEFRDRGEYDLQLVACSGHGKNGAITVLQRSVRPHIVTTFELPGCADMWTVLTAEQEDSMDLNTLQDISAHAFLILSHKESTMVLQTGQEITELDSSGFITSSPTVFAGNIGEKKYILQVTSSTVQLLQGVEKVHQITVDTSHGAVIACDVVGPYGVLLLQEGVGLLKLHEEQGEQLLEAGMSLRDEQSFMGDDNTKGSILTLEWPTLEQGSRITCVSVYKDTSGIFSLDVVDAEVFYPRRRKSSERTPQIARTPSKSLIDEEDELLYGDASGIQVKKEETRPSVFSHIPSTPVKHSGRSTATYWCALAREDGSMEIYSLPEFNLVYSVRNFSAAPRVLVDSGPIYTHSSSHQVTSSEHRVKELLLTGMGPQYSYPHLLAFIDNDLVIYKAYQYPLSSVQGHLQLRFSKHNHRILLRDKKDSKIAKSSELMDDAEGGKPSPHVPQLRVFRDVAGYCGVFVCGPYPHWLFMTERGALRCHPMSVDGPVVTFSSFHNVNCKKGFLYFNNEGELRIAVLPTYLSYDSHWPVRKVPTKSTAHFVSYHPDAKIHAVITSEDQICQVIPKMNGDETISLDSVEKDDRFVHPTCEKYSLQLYSPTVWEPVPNARHEFDDFEHVVTMKVMNLRSQETIAGRKPFIVIGTLTVHGEEVSSRGKIVIYDVIEVVPEPGKPLTKHKMKLLCSKDQKGPVTALDNIDGLLLTCIGQKIFLWTFRDNKDIVGVAFIDTKLYIHSVACIRNFILVADLHQGAMLMQYREDLKTLSVISKDPFVRNVYSTEYVVDGQQLGFIITDDEGNIVIYQYQPEVPESQGGKHLVQRCDINTGARVNCLFRIKCKPSISPMLSREIQVAVTERRHATYFATLDGGLGYVIPLPEKTYRRFSMLQAKLVTGLPHAAGLNPKGFRMFHAPRQTIAYPQRNLLDGELLWRYPLLSNKERFDFAKQIGTAQNQILDDLMDIERNTAHL